MYKEIARRKKASGSSEDQLVLLRLVDKSLSKKNSINKEKEGMLAKGQWLSK
jgi:hypothetical protein